MNDSYTTGILRNQTTNNSFKKKTALKVYNTNVSVNYFTECDVHKAKHSSIIDSYSYTCKLYKPLLNVGGPLFKPYFPMAILNMFCPFSTGQYSIVLNFCRKAVCKKSVSILFSVVANCRCTVPYPKSFNTRSKNIDPPDLQAFKGLDSTYVHMNGRQEY
uniref:Uncharacterized protein n=1 Tax=Glossina brevipalpis TaxID=37001 RepID=A0A1A9W0Q1_9MUSC